MAGKRRASPRRVGKRLGAGGVDIGEDDRLAPVTVGGQARDRLAHRADTKQQDSHRKFSLFACGFRQFRDGTRLRDRIPVPVRHGGFGDEAFFGPMSPVVQPSS